LSVALNDLYEKRLFAKARPPIASAEPLQNTLKLSRIVSAWFLKWCHGATTYGLIWAIALGAT
jgi:hypothetical protein